MYPNEHPDHDLEQQLRTIKPPTSEPPLHFRERLKSRLLSKYNDQRVPKKHLVQRTLVVIPLLTILLIGLIAWFGNTQVVSAAEIVERASQVANGSTAFGLQSYHSVQLYWWRDHVALESMGELKIGSQTHIWYQNPDKTRYESYSIITNKIHSALDYVTVPTEAKPQSTPITTPKDTRAVFTMLRLTVGNDDWTYQVDPPEVIIQSARKPGVPEESNATDIKELIATLSRDNDNVKLTGSDVIAGRDVYVLQYTPKPGAFSMLFLASVISYIDKEAYIPLAVHYLHTNGEPINKWEFVEFEANPDLDPDLFVFQIPPDVSVQDVRATTIPTEAELLEAWHNAKDRVDFALFVPTYWPERFIPEKPYVNAWKEWRDTEYTVSQYFYTSRNKRWGLFISESPRTYGAIPGQETIQIGDIEGQYGNSFENWHMVTFARDGTTIQIMSVIEQISKEELIKVAEGMQPLNTLGTPEPTSESR